MSRDMIKTRVFTFFRKLTRGYVMVTSHVTGGKSVTTTVFGIVDSGIRCYDPCNHNSVMLSGWAGISRNLTPALLCTAQNAPLPFSITAQCYTIHYTPDYAYSATIHACAAMRVRASRYTILSGEGGAITIAGELVSQSGTNSHCLPQFAHVSVGADVVAAMLPQFPRLTLKEATKQRSVLRVNLPNTARAGPNRNGLTTYTHIFRYIFLGVSFAPALSPVFFGKQFVYPADEHYHTPVNVLAHLNNKPSSFKSQGLRQTRVKMGLTSATIKLIMVLMNTNTKQHGARTMNQTLADTLNSHIQPDGTLNMRKVIATLEAYYKVDALDAIFTGGSVAHDEAVEAYEIAAQWNKEVKAAQQDEQTTRRGISPFMFTLPVLAAMASLLAVAASMI